MFGTDMLRFSNSGSMYRSATTKTKSGRSCDLVTFLGVAQYLHIDFLPITWQPALDLVGRGGTAEIREAVMSLHASFAFKRPLVNLSEEEELDSVVLASMIAEVSILGHTSIRSHPNIIRLEGIAWQVLRGDWEHAARDGREEERSPTMGSRLIPVLVFERTKYGDLGRFMRSDKGKHLSAVARLELGISIADAVITMHSNNIIHGDLKPENVLVFEAHYGVFSPKVADFGYSTYYASDHDTIYMPKSQPWAAPEWHHRGFTPAQAMRMDTYSFGMLMLWLLCYSTCPITDFVNDVDVAPNLQTLACQRVLKTFHNQRHSLVQFFNLALGENSSHRCSDIKHLRQLLAPDMLIRGQGSVPTIKGMDLKDACFCLAPSIYQLYSNDYRIRHCVALSLFERMRSTGTGDASHSTSHQVLLQCALCLELGFGVTRNAKQSEALVAHCEECQAELQYQITCVKSGGKIGTNPLKFSEGLFRELSRQGQLQIIDLSQAYRGQERLENVERHYKREIDDVKSALGPDHEILIILKGQLKDIYFEYGQYEEAEEITAQILETREKLLRHPHADILSSTSDLAALYSFQERYAEAKELQIQVVEGLQNMLGEKHPRTLHSVAGLASIYQSEGLWDRAMELQREVMQSDLRIFGPEHLHTLKSMVSLAQTYHAQGSWEEAENMMKSVIDISNRVEGQDHPHTIYRRDFLVGFSRAQGRWNDAEELDLHNQSYSRKIFEDKEPTMYNQLLQLNNVYMMQNRWKDAEAVGMEIIERKRKASGDEAVDTWNCIGELATVYKRQKRWKEAEKLDVYVLEMHQKRFGDDHMETLVAMMNLAITYRDQRPFDEAEQLDLKILGISQELLGEEHEFTLSAMDNLAATYTRHRRFDKCIALHQHLLEIRTRILGEEHEDTLNTLSDLWSIHWVAQKRQEGFKFLERFTCLTEKVHGLQSPITLEAKAGLAHSYYVEGQKSKAIDLMTEVVHLRKEGNIEDFPDDIVPTEDVLKEWLGETTEAFPAS